MPVSTGVIDGILLAIHIAFIGSAFLTVQPFFRSVQVESLKTTVLTSILMHVGRLVRRVSIPRSSSAILPWIQTSVPTTEVFNIGCTLLILVNRSASLVFVSQGILAIYHTMSLLNAVLQRYGRGNRVVQDIYKLLAQRQKKALLLMGLCDLFALIQLAVSCTHLGIRGLLINIYMYLGMLKGRYKSPESASYHQEAWALVGKYTRPLLIRVPVVDRLTNSAISWFIQ
jgi:hypothetical protein